MMRQIYSIFLILFLISCSSNDNTEEQPSIETNNLEIYYRGYYQVYFEEPYQNEVYNNVNITSITEEISDNETVDLLKISAYLDNDTENVIIFKVFKNAIGNNVLYNNSFSFRSYGATYFPSDLDFEVTKNNETEFAAIFSGELEHWYQGELRYVYLDISSASISITH